MDVWAELIRSVCKSRIELFRQGMPLIKGAVLVEDKLDYGMLRKFSVYYDNPELDLRIFSKIEDAWEWLEVAGSGAPFVGMEPDDPRSPCFLSLLSTCRAGQADDVSGMLLIVQFQCHGNHRLLLFP